MSCYAGPEMTNEGILLRLDAKDVNSYPGTGTTWYDLSGNDNHGDIQNGAVFDVDGFVLDGTNDKIEIQNNGQLSFNTEEFTISIWMKRIGPTGSTYTILCVAETAATNNFQLDFSDTIGSLRFYYSSSSAVNTSYDAPDEELINIVITRNGSGATSAVELFVNGVRVGGGTPAYTDYNYTVGLRAGANRALGTYLSCKISNITIYNKSLMPEEIQRNFYALRGRYGI